MTTLGPPGLRLVSNSQGVPATMYGAAKGIVALMSAESCVRPSAVEKNLLGMRRVPSSFSGPTACVGVRGAQWSAQLSFEDGAGGGTYGLRGGDVLVEERQVGGELLDRHRAAVRGHEVDRGLHRCPCLIGRQQRGDVDERGALQGTGGELHTGKAHSQ